MDGRLLCSLLASATDIKLDCLQFGQRYTYYFDYTARHMKLSDYYSECLVFKLLRKLP